MNCRWLISSLWLVLAGLLVSVATAAEEVSQAQTSINEAIAYIEANRIEQALESAKSAIRAEPTRVEGHLLYIQLMIQMNRRSDVKAQYDELRNQNKGGLALMLYGRTLETPEAQLATFRKSLEVDPDLAWAHYCIATVHLQQGQADEAVKSLEEGIRLKPEFVQAKEFLATLLLSMGKTDEAIVTFEEVLERNPDDAKTLFQLGSIVGRQGDTERAAKLLEKSLELVPEHPQVMANLAFMYFKLKRYDEAMALYDKALKLVPDRSDVRLNREVVRRVKKGALKFEAVTEMEKAMAARSAEEAMRHYRRVIELSPDFELPYVALGQLLAATERFDEAENAFKEAVRLNPGFVEGVRMLAEFYLVAKQPTKAEPYLVKAIELSPESPELRAALGAAYAASGRPKEAEQAFTAASQMLPPTLALGTRVQMAKAIATQGRFADAARELRGVLQDAPGTDQARLELGNCYFAMEDFDKAREQYQLLLEKAPDSKELEALLEAVASMQAEYRNKSKDHLRARHILVKTQGEAEEVLKQIEAGASFEQLARERSIGPEAGRGGDIGFFKKGELLSDFEAAVEALEVGQISGVVHTSSGYHVIKRLN